MAYRFDARGHRAPLAAALAAVMFGGVGADAYAGSSGDNRKIGAKAEEVRARLYQSPLERIRAKYGLKQEQPGTDPLVGANANPGHQFKADANRGKPGKVDMDAINRLAQPKVLKSAKTESKPEVQPRRVASKAKPGGDLQRRGGVVQRALPPEALRAYDYKPVPSFKLVTQALGDRAGREQRREKQARTSRAYDTAAGMQAQPPHPAFYGDAELRDLSSTEAVLALLQSADFKVLFELDESDAKAVQRAVEDLRPEQAAKLTFGNLWWTVTGQRFNSAGLDGRCDGTAFTPWFQEVVEQELSGEDIFGFKLPEAMPFQQLPYREHIVAVVARVSDATSQIPRYVVAEIGADNRLCVPGGFKSRGSGLQETACRQHEFDAEQLRMAQVEYVLYEPYFYYTYPLWSEAFGPATFNRYTRPRY